MLGKTNRINELDAGSRIFHGPEQELFRLENMVRHGFTKRFARFFQNLAEKDYEAGFLPVEQIEWAHMHGFLADRVPSYQLTEKNCNLYLSDYDYYRLWPLNNPYRIWINDKLTLKYILPAERFSEVLPEYYYYIEERGVIPMMDWHGPVGVEGVVSLLKKKKVLAMKPVNGTGSNDFYKLSEINGCLYVNESRMSDDEFCDFINTNMHFIITEYLVPGEQFKRIHEKIHTLRLLVLNDTGISPNIVGGYLRFGTDGHGEANHLRSSSDCHANFDFYTQIDIDTGEYGQSILLYPDKVVSHPRHPDTNMLAEGVIPKYEELKMKVLEIARYLFQAEWMGFDIGLTDDGFKIMEINSHPGIQMPQITKPFWDNERLATYLKKRLILLDDLSEEKKLLRAEIPR